MFREFCSGVNKVDPRLTKRLRTSEIKTCYLIKKSEQNGYDNNGYGRFNGGVFKCLVSF